MKIIKLHYKTIKKHENHIIPQENNENHEHLEISFENNENHENNIIPLENNENHEILEFHLKIMNIMKS